MASVNRVMILGNLGADPELRYTPNQLSVVNLSVATTDVRTVDGQKQEKTDWHRVVVYGKNAENCAKYLTKGRAVFIEGRISNRSWEDKESGQKRYVTEIIANNVQFISGGSKSSSDYTTNTQSAYGSEANDAAATTTTGFSAPETAQVFDDIPF